jgi:hypothetical protein
VLSALGGAASSETILDRRGVRFFPADAQQHPAHAADLGRRRTIRAVHRIRAGHLPLPYSLAELPAGQPWFAVTGQMPWRLMRFPADACTLGDLRQEGAVYQIRHAAAGEWLTGL